MCSATWDVLGFREYQGALISGHECKVTPNYPMAFQRSWPSAPVKWVSWKSEGIDDDTLVIGLALQSHSRMYCKYIGQTHRQKYIRLRCLLRVKGLVIWFFLDWSGSIFQFRQSIIKVVSKSWLLTCSSNITLSLPPYTGSALKRELYFCPQSRYTRKCLTDRNFVAKYSQQVLHFDHEVIY